MNQDLIRYEKHRVWVVEGTLKDGERHIYSKRTMYIGRRYAGQRLSLTITMVVASYGVSVKR